MANQSRGEIELQLNGGEPLIWRLRWKDIAEIEHALEQLKGVRTTWWRFRSGMGEWDIHDLALVLWAGLRYTGKFADPEAVLEAMDFTIQDEFITKFSDQIMNSLPEDMKKKLQGAQAAAVAEAAAEKPTTPASGQ